MRTLLQRLNAKHHHFTQYFCVWRMEIKKSFPICFFYVLDDFFFLTSFIVIYNLKQIPKTDYFYLQYLHSYFIIIIIICRESEFIKIKTCNFRASVDSTKEKIIKTKNLSNMTFVWITCDKQHVTCYHACLHNNTFIAPPFFDLNSCYWKCDNILLNHFFFPVKVSDEWHT